MPYADAKKINDQYFTKPETARWCLDLIKDHYDLEGKTAFEPACGGGVFVAASEDEGLKWKTNELFPQEGREGTYDFEDNFLKSKDQQELETAFGRYDFVITNPPFGNGSRMAKDFVHNALKIANVVGMVLPKACRRDHFIDTLPPDVRIVEDRNLEDKDFTEFILPDGSEKKVGCIFMVFSHVKGYVRKQRADYHEEGYTGKSDGNVPPEWATHFVPLIYNHAGKLVKVGSDHPKPALSNYYMALSKKQAKALEDFSMMDVVARTRTSYPAVSWYDVRTAINKHLRGES